MTADPEKPAAGALDRLRRFCMGFPETSETGSWGHPNFRAGKRTFATFEWVAGRPSIALLVGSDEADAMLIGNPGFFATPYGRGNWVSVWADGKLDWDMIESLAERAYRSVALKRMLAALDRKPETQTSTR